MTQLPQLLVESSFCLLVFYAFYILVLSQETFFQANRLYLLLMPLVALLIPSLNITLNNAAEPSSLGVVPTVVYPLLEESVALEEFLWTAPLDDGRRVTFGQLVFIVYLTGVVFLLYRLCLNIYELYREIAGSQVRLVDSCHLVPNSKFPASSFFGFVFWQGRELTAEQRLIWEHEKVHIRQWHSLDVLLMEMWVILQWFNPLVYFFRSRLRETHEYIADRYVSGRLGSKTEYALYLAGFRDKGRQLSLLNNFAQLLKKRLLMLARNKSRDRRLMRYLLILPLFVSLMMLFSFDLVEELPHPVGQPFLQAESYLTRVGETELLKLGKTGALPDTAVYQVRWEDKLCDCQPGQLPNYFHCENRSFKPAEFRRIARKGGFSLLMNGQPVEYRELQVQSARALKIKPVETQFDFQNVFNPKAAFWKKIKKGDVLKFTFHSMEKSAFHFDLTINDGSDSFDHAYDVYLGEVWIPIDMTSSIGIKYITFEEFQKSLGHPIRMVKNIDEEVRLKSIQSGRINMSLQSGKFRLRKAGDIPNLRIARPGDRKHLTLVSEDGHKVAVSIKIRNLPEEAAVDDSWHFRWGTHETGPRYPVLTLSETEAHRLITAPMSVVNSAGPVELSAIESVSLNRYTGDPSDPANARFGARNVIAECQVEDQARDRGCLNDILSQARIGDQIILASMHAAEMSPISVVVNVLDKEAAHENRHFRPFLQVGIDNGYRGYVLRGIDLTEKNLRQFVVFRDLEGNLPLVRMGEQVLKDDEAAKFLNELSAYEVEFISFVPKRAVIRSFDMENYGRSMFLVRLKGNDLIRRYTIQGGQEVEPGSPTIKFEDLGRDFFVLVDGRKEGILSGQELKDLILQLKPEGIRKVEILEASPRVIAEYGKEARDGMVIITTMN